MFISRSSLYHLYHIYIAYLYLFIVASGRPRLTKRRIAQVPPWLYGQYIWGDTNRILYIDIYIYTYVYTYTYIYIYIYTCRERERCTDIMYTYIYIYIYRVVSNRVVSKGPLYPSSTKTVTLLMFAG